MKYPRGKAMSQEEVEKVRAALDFTNKVAGAVVSIPTRHGAVEVLDGRVSDATACAAFARASVEFRNFRNAPEDKPRVAIFVAGGRLSEEQIRAVEEWIKAHPEANGRIELKEAQVRDLLPAALVALLDKHFGT